MPHPIYTGREMGDDSEYGVPLSVAKPHLTLLINQTTTLMQYYARSYRACASATTVTGAPVRRESLPQIVQVDDSLVGCATTTQQKGTDDRPTCINVLRSLETGWNWRTFLASGANILSMPSRTRGSPPERLGRRTARYEVVYTTFEGSYHLYNGKNLVG
jgi:hypothetical protein